ncbi:MAG: hypothetical protein AAGK22_11650 [Acidobacteriota bacterium]
MIRSTAASRLATVLFAASCFLTACEERTHIPIDVINEHAAAQRLGQITPGWNLRHIGRDPESARRIVHRVEVNPERAGEILMMSGGEKNDLVGGLACPQADAQVWASLTRSQDVIIDLRTEKGSFETISCRSAVF